MRHLLLSSLLALGLTVSAQIPDYVPTDGLIAWYPMNGNALDESGNGYHCDSFGAVLTADRHGASSSAFYFDGEGSHLRGASLPFSDLSISLWFKHDSGGYTYTYDPNSTPPIGAQLVGQGTAHNPCSWADFAIGFADAPTGNDDLLAWEKSNAGGCSVQQSSADWLLETDTWIHLIAISQGTQVDFFIDGDWVNSVEFDEPFNFTGSVFSIGARYVENCSGGEPCSGPGNAWSGAIDDVAVWNRALTPQEISSLYNGVGPITGCTDELACNYNPEANVNDGTCVHQSLVEDISIKACDSYEWEGLTLTESGVYSVSNLASIESVTYGGQFQNSHYFVTTDVMEWLEGADMAESLGGELCILNSEEELSFVVNTLSQHFTPGSQTNGVQEGAWVGLYNQQWINGETGITLPCVHFDGDGPFGMLNLNDSTYQGGSGDPCFSDEQETWHNVVALIEVPVYALCEQLSELDLTILSCEDVQAFCGPGTLWDESTRLCVVANVSDTDFDGCVGINDFLIHLSNFGSGCGPELTWSCGDQLEYQGYDYETVQIGEQCWFAENLRAENYRNGDAIQLVVDDIDWDNIDGDAVRSSPAPNAHPNAGQLYTFFVASDGRGVCPNEWHVPSHEEWMVLELDLGLDAIELENWGQSRGDLGLKMKSCSEWNGDCSMQSGFNAVYSSVRPGNGPEDGGYSAEENSAFWSSTPDVGAWYRSLTFNAIGIHAWYDGDGGNAGFSIRCIKDSE